MAINSGDVGKFFAKKMGYDEIEDGGYVENAYGKIRFHPVEGTNN